MNRCVVLGAKSAHYVLLCNTICFREHCVSKQKWQQIGPSIKLTQTAADKDVLGRGTEASASSLIIIKAFCRRAPGRERREHQRFRIIFFEDLVTIDVICHRPSPAV